MAEHLRAELPAPWEVIHPETDDATSFEMQFAAECGPGHVLHGRQVRAVALRVGHDDVLFSLDYAGDPWARTHLTWADTPQRPPFPATETWSTWQEMIDGLSRESSAG